MIPRLSKQKKPEKQETYPVLPVKDNVLFPGMALTLTIGEKRSKKLIADLKPGDKIIITALKDIRLGVADTENIYKKSIDAFIANDRLLAIDSIKLYRNLLSQISKLRSSLEQKRQIPIDFLDIVYMFDRIAKSWADIADLISPIYNQ